MRISNRDLKHLIRGNKGGKQLCSTCGKNKFYFYKTFDICWACISSVPSHIPDEQVKRYIKKKYPEVGIAILI